jgi:predicted small secreted protein
MRFLLGLIFGAALGFAVTTYINQHIQASDENAT